MNEIERPSGLIKTLPTLYGDPGQAKERFELTLAKIAEGKMDHFYIFLPGKPSKEVLHVYILIDGQIRVRCNLADCIPHDGEMNSWDGQKRKPKYLLVCTAPISYPPEPIYRKGFQGIRYTTDLW